MRATSPCAISHAACCADPQALFGFSPIQLVTSLRSSKSSGPLLEAKGGKIAVKGTGTSNASHTMSEDERSAFTAHINGVRRLILP